jgi:hypothetical protein
VERLTSWLFLASAMHRLVKDKNIHTLLEVRKDDENPKGSGEVEKGFAKLQGDAKVAEEPASSDRE